VVDFLVISTISTEQLSPASHPSDLPFPSRQALCRFGIPGSLFRGRRPFNPVVKPGCTDAVGAAHENFIKLASLWDVLHLGIWGCWPRSPAQRDIGRAWSVGWSSLAPYWFRGVFEQLHRAIARTCLASFAGSFFRAGCYAGRRRWRARAQRACEKATLLSCPRRSERFAANPRCLLGFGS